jgi:hypothetical protein
MRPVMHDSMILWQMDYGTGGNRAAVQLVPYLQCVGIETL